MTGPDIAAPIELHAERHAVDAAIADAGTALADVAGSLADVAERLAHIRASLSAGSRLDVVAGDLRVAAHRLTARLDGLPDGIERLADRLTIGVEADVAHRLALAERALAGPALGAVARRPQVAA